METVTYISFCSSLLYKSVTHDPMTIKQNYKIKKSSLQNGLFMQRKHSKSLENHPFFKKGTQVRASSENDGTKKFLIYSCAKQGYC